MNLHCQQTSQLCGILAQEPGEHPSNRMQPVMTVSCHSYYRSCELDFSRPAAAQLWFYAHVLSF